jgi:hypothetical protein
MWDNKKYTILYRKPERKNHFADIGEDGKILLK